MPLEESSDTDRDRIAEIIAQMAEWPGFAASVATKVLHKKRPATVPIRDNQAIFGAYMNADWPNRPSATDSVYNRSRIGEALGWIWRAALYAFACDLANRRVDTSSVGGFISKPGPEGDNASIVSQCRGNRAGEVNGVIDLNSFVGENTQHPLPSFLELG